MNDFKGFVIALIGLAIFVYGLYARTKDFSWAKEKQSIVFTVDPIIVDTK